MTTEYDYFTVDYLKMLEPKLYTLGVFTELLKYIESDTYSLIKCGNISIEYDSNSLYLIADTQKGLFVNNDRQACLDFVKEQISKFE